MIIWNFVGGQQILGHSFILSPVHFLLGLLEVSCNFTLHLVQTVQWSFLNKKTIFPYIDLALEILKRYPAMAYERDEKD